MPAEYRDVAKYQNVIFNALHILVLFSGIFACNRHPLTRMVLA
jgi:hypothetical protein